MRDIRRVNRPWIVALAAFFVLAGAGTAAIFLDRDALGFGLLIAAGFVTVGWNEWKRKRGFR